MTLGRVRSLAWLFFFGGTAISLGLLYPNSPLAATKPDSVVSIKDRMIDSHGVLIAVREYGGKGRPILFVHGGPGPNLANWDSFARRLVDRYRPIAYDQRGHGQSGSASDYSYAALARDIQSIIDTLHLGKPIIVGHSWGGQIATIYAARNPTCAGVIAVDGIIPSKPQNITKDQWAALENEVRTNRVTTRTNNFAGNARDLERLLAWVQKEAPKYYPDFEESTYRRGLAAGPDGLLRQKHTVDEFLAITHAVYEQEQKLPGIEIYKDIHVPFMLVLAKRGDRFSREDEERIAKENPQLRIEWMDSGHYLQKEHSEELAVLLDSFVAHLEH